MIESMMLAQFHNLYPNGSIISELIEIFQGKYIVRCQLSVVSGQLSVVIQHLNKLLFTPASPTSLTSVTSLTFPTSPAPCFIYGQ
ncbi:MAG: hypothetical protein ACKPA8_05595 [Dolichospermum sp.]